MARSKTSANAILYYEAGQEFSAMAALSDSGDHKKFTSGDGLWSGASGKEPDVKPDGLATGGEVSTADSGSNDVVDVAALTCYLAGVETSVAASADFSITRPASDVAKVNSITVTSAGALSEVEGTDGSDGTFSAERGAAGGPPYIPEGSIEIAQVRLTTSAAAVITASEIKQVVGTHCERYDMPLFDINYTGGEVDFYSALPAIHTGDVTKGVYAEYYTPTMAEAPNAYDFVPPENSHSVSSEQVYGGTVGATSSSLNQGSFSMKMQDGISDPILSAVDDTRWFKFLQDRLQTSRYVVCQGVLGLARSFPAGANVEGSFTISATEKAQNKTS